MYTEELKLFFPLLHIDFFLLACSIPSAGSCGGLSDSVVTRPKQMLCRNPLLDNVSFFLLKSDEVGIRFYTSPSQEDWDRLEDIVPSLSQQNNTTPAFRGE
jgi:hypothetical protein